MKRIGNGCSVSSGSQGVAYYARLHCRPISTRLLCKAKLEWRDLPLDNTLVTCEQNMQLLMVRDVEHARVIVLYNNELPRLIYVQGDTIWMYNYSAYWLDLNDRTLVDYLGNEIVTPHMLSKMQSLVYHNTGATHDEARWRNPIVGLEVYFDRHPNTHLWHKQLYQKAMLIELVMQSSHPIVPRELTSLIAALLCTLCFIK